MTLEEKIRVMEEALRYMADSDHDDARDFRDHARDVLQKTECTPAESSSTGNIIKRG